MPQPASQATLAPGTILTKRYRIEAVIGSGGYASVYRATDLQFGYERAIKEVSDPDPGVRTQFRLESELLINSRHPNIPHGFHLIEDFGRLYLVMDYVHGKDLEELLNESLTQRRRPLDEAQVLRWAIDICGALDEMHNLKVPVIHRDIKPANIKITPDKTPILIDFGLAKLQQQGVTRTAAQGVSPGFAPPEQYMAKGRTDPRTDIYGLGATLYACLTGKDPPEAPSRLLALPGAGGSSGVSLVSPRKLNPAVSEAADRVIMKALELSPNNRQQTARQFRDELSAALEQLAHGATGASPAVGRACPRCGTRNRPEATTCARCGGSLRPTNGPQRKAPTLGSAGEGTGKRPAVAGTPGARTGLNAPPPGVLRLVTPEVSGAQRTGRQVAVGNQRTGKQPAISPEPRTARHAAVSPDQRTGKQPVPQTDQGSGKQRALAQRVDAGGPAVAGKRDMPGLPASRDSEAKTPAPKGAPAASDSQVTGTVRSMGGVKPWIRMGAVPLGRFGKAMLVLAGIEMLWGMLVLSLGIVALATRGKPLPVVQLVVGWLIVVLLASVLGAQAVTRPIYRSGKLTKMRRWLQGMVLVLYAVAVHGVAVWGATIFATGQANETLALLTFLVFGVSVSVGGLFGIWNTLG